ncbi:uncharacterized protein LOC110619395 isoform X2 [Manihot esculenta]|uniref:uncharacterized protein LOC110619395 isoform X2 n=1 Tax=Manihot esculenta TaxID=3983 RepID=UPI001CC632ED|nr:uncharacterized protein LOC110619395 isoform X2 [Manihot esculenta]
MAAESNSGFRRDEALGSAFKRPAMSFHSDAINNSSEMIPMGSFFGMNASTSTVMLPGTSSMINNSPGILHVQAVNSSASSLLLDSAAGLKHDTGLAVEWSVDEQYKLEEGLNKFADEPSIMRYIKIAATLPDKTVRDVALRCRWMTRKRRKAEEYNLGKKVNNRKDKLVESSSKMNISSAVPQNMPVYPLMTHHVDHGNTLSFEELSGTSRHLLEQNAQAFSKITANLSTFKHERDAWHNEPDATTACIN